MCILDCLLVSATIFYTNKAKIWMGVVTSLHQPKFDDFATYYHTFAIAIPLLNVDYRHFAIENRPQAKLMTRCWLRFSEMTEWRIAAIERFLYPPDRGGSSLSNDGGGVTADFFKSETICVFYTGMWLTELIDLSLRTILPIHSNGKHRPFWGPWPIALK